ncbi:MOP flippase family protein [Bradyrhizobium sp. MOS002]|uniref:MOP flippase family protein n=1 Tax=Bradyrhizobium sp. MOS002 TaxID=2133947 RepID=UPI0013048A63|nr:MOP flippase family protein [Bradyrhizobium sp. MOS002]
MADQSDQSQKTSSLRSIAVDGAKWTSAASVVNTLVQMGQFIVLARLLSPSDFGIVGMAAVFIGFAQTYLDMGMSSAVVQRVTNTREQLSSLYWLNIFTGLALFIIAVCATPFIAHVYAEDRLYRLFPLCALLFVIAPIGAQFMTLLQREMEFRTIAKIEIVSTALGTLVAIALAIQGFGPFSLVLGQLTSASATSLQLLVSCWKRWAPSFTFGLHNLKGYLGFGLYQMGERTLNFIGSRIDQLLIGAMLGSTALGYYMIAWNLVIMPVGRINPILTRVAFPIFSRLQNDSESLKRGYLLVIRIVAIVNAPLLLGCAAAATNFILVVYGPQWLPSVPILMALCGVGLIRSIGNPIGTLQLARGRADLGFYFNFWICLLQLIGVIAGLALGGALGVATSLLITHVIILAAVYYFMVRKLIGDCFSEFAFSFTPAICHAAIMGLLVAMLPIFFSTSSAYVDLAIQVSFGTAVYTSEILLFPANRRVLSALLARA